MELPKYQSHKVVEAFKIGKIRYWRSGGAVLKAEDGLIEQEVDSAYVLKHDPHPGGYYVRYATGYESFSPADAFEAGYTRIED